MFLKDPSQRLDPVRSGATPNACIATCVLLVCLLFADSARAWEFVSVVDSTGPYSQFTPPAINASGAVAFRATADAGGRAVLAGDVSDVDVVASSAGLYTDEIATQVAIGDEGTVLFQAQSDAGVLGVFRGPDPVADAVTTTAQGFSFVDAPAIDAQGNVVVGAGLAGKRGIYLGTTALVDDDEGLDFFARPAINDTGTVAFRATLDGGGSGAFTVPLAGGGTATVADTDGPFAVIGDSVAINDAGTVVFAASLDAGLVSGLYTGPDPLVDRVVDTSGPFQAFEQPAIADDGTVTFFAFLDTGFGGIFAGPDPVADKVIVSGEPLFGSIAGTVNFRTEGARDGRIAFSYFLTDGRTGVAVAFAPEPASAMGTAAAAIALLALRARRSGAAG